MARRSVRAGVLLGAVGMVATLLTGTGPVGAAFPGVNGKLTCASFRDGNFEIYTYNPDGSDPRRLTFHPATDFESTFSPDGTQIAFMSQRTGDQEIWIMYQDGSGLRRLSFAGGEDRPGSFTPDGKKILFHSARFFTQLPPGPGHSALEIMIMNADGSNPTRLTDNLFQDSFPHASPDGQRIAFTSNRASGDFEIYTMKIDGTDVRRVTNSPGEDAHASWSPDGQQLVFHSRRAPHGPQLEIYRQRADGSTPAVRLTNDDVAFDAFPVWSPDGQKIAWNRGFPPPKIDVYTMNAADGSALTAITDVPDGVFDFRCDWGRRLPCTVSASSPGVIRGTEGDDVICGTPGNDVIYGFGGNDVIYAGAGNDQVFAGAGNDIVFGEHGNDRILGGDGNDVLFGDQGDDEVQGEGGNDVVSGSEGTDRVTGGPGTDECYGEHLFSCELPDGPGASADVASSSDPRQAALDRRGHPSG